MLNVIFSNNIHIIGIKVDFQEEIEDNPKTSAVTAFSLIHAINRRENSIVI